MGKGEKPILSVRVDAELLARVDAVVEQSGVGRAEIVEWCLHAGLVDSEELVEALQSPVRGPLVRLATNPLFVKALAAALGREVDGTFQKVRDGVGPKAKRSRLRPAQG